MQRDWQKIWRTNFTNVSSLLDFCDIKEEQRAAILENPSFPCSVPRRFAEKMEKGSIDDPLFRQVVPLKEEIVTEDGFTDDPLKEDQFHCSPCLIQKYHGRALLMTGSACSMNCRFCFRRHFPYCSTLPTEKDYLSINKGIDEVILSGGEPFALPTKNLAEIFSQLEKIPNIQRIRFHTRFPIGIPERIDEELLTLFARCKKQIVVVLHVNHKKELDEEIATPLKKIATLNIPILAQTVLLKGVNDSVSALTELMQSLSNIGVIPYYLHQLDRVQGAAHFEVPISKGQQLIAELQKTLSGYMVPRYVQEVPGKESKSLLHL